MYGIGGEHDLAERELPHLDGWRSSQPVRIGNAAWEQTQHDTYGVLLDAVHCYRDQLDGLDPSTKQFLIALVDHAATSGPNRTRASGRSAASRATTCTPR